MTPAALYVRADSIYKKLLGEKNCWDAARDAKKYTGGQPVIAHPPCADYCRLAHLHPRQPERAECAVIAIRQVRKCGGVLEHPKHSKLWKEQNIPLPGHLPDEFGGITIAVRQFDFGHIAEKPTWLYVVRASIPPLPPRREGKGKYLWQRHKDADKAIPQTKQSLGDDRLKVREHTPPAFAKYLIKIARSVK